MSFDLVLPTIRSGIYVTFRPLTPGAFWTAQITRARDAIRSGHSNGLHTLARTLFEAYKHGHDTGRLSEALAILRQLRPLAGCTAEDADTVGRLLDLGDVLLAEYRRVGDIELVNEMIHAFRRTRPSGATQARHALQLAAALLERCTYFGEEADLSAAKALLDKVPATNSDSPLATVVLAFYHITRWDALSQYDLPELQRLKDTLVHELQKHVPARRNPVVLALCFRICSILSYLHGPDVVNSIADVAREAADIDASSFPLSDVFAAWISLAFLYIWLARNTKAWAHMEVAKGLLERMSHLGKGCQNTLNDAMYSCLGLWLHINERIFKATDAVTLTRAISAFQSALGLLPSSHIRRRSALVGLTFILGAQWQNSGRRSCLDEIIRLADSNRDQIGNARFILNVTEAMLQRAEAGRLRAVSILTLLEHAIQLLQATLAVTPEATRYRGYLLKHLSWAYRLQSLYGVEVDKEERIRVAADIATSLNDDSKRRTIAKATLARVLLDIAMSSHDLEALNRSVSLIQQLPHSPGSEENGAVLNARGYAVRYQLLRDPRDLAMCKDTLEAALMIDDALIHRMRDVASCLTVAQYLQDTHFALSICRHIIGLLPRLAYVGQDIETRVQALQLAEGLACRAAGVALASSDICSAVELLEQSRGVVWSQALHLRVSSASVPSQHRQQFERITDRLDRAGSSGADTSERWSAAAEFEDIVAEIRHVDGYQRFLLPRLYPELKACAEHGFVVLVIPSDTVTNVITISSPESSLRHLQTPALNLPRLQTLTETLKRMSDRSRASAGSEQRKVKLVDVNGVPQTSRSKSEKEYAEVLGELWTKLVYPVITSLGIERSSADAPQLRPRLWWCPTGPFAELPLHAAGVYSGPGQDYLANYVVSSYTPTLSALINAQERQNDADSDEAGVLLVSMAKTAGLSSLPNALVEADLVREATPPEHLSTLSDSHASISNVLGKLPDAAVLHLACHGHQSQDDPLTSGFSLHDGRLTLEKVMQLRLPKARLAYLSACETASTDEYQPDEAINLAATMLFVGFKSVVATMWSMDDLDGPFVADRMYRAIYREGKLDWRAAPYALDAAVQELRQTGAHPSRWATYVHIGA